MNEAARSQEAFRLLAVITMLILVCSCKVFFLIHGRQQNFSEFKSGVIPTSPRPC